VRHGANDEDGEKVAGNPTTVPDLLATMAVQLGIDPAHTEVSPSGRPISVTDGGRAIRALVS
jgi:hypothetical protein